MSVQTLKKDLRDLMDRAGIKATHAQAGEVLDGLWDKIVKQARENARLTIRGFGTFRFDRAPARKGRNPATGAQIDIPARDVFKFKSLVGT